MKLGRTLYVTNRQAWRSWLAKNHRTAKEIWLIYYRKETGKPRIAYNAAVEEALCYGWIDSTGKKIDNERYAQRYSPRRKTSVLSQINKERIRVLIARKKMTKAGLAAVAHVFDPAKKPGRLVIPPAILKALRADKRTWANFRKFPDQYKRIRVAYVASQRRHGDTAYQRALNYLIKMTARNKRFGFVKEMS